MPRAATFVALALALAAAACGDDSEAKAEALTEERYAKLMRAHTDILIEELESWAKADFATQAEAGDALMRLTPVSEHSQQRLRELLADHGVSGADVAVFVTEHPAAVDRASAEMQKRFDQAFEWMKPSLERIEELPRGDVDAVAERWRRSIAAHAAPPRRGEDTLTGWTAVASRADLAAAVNSARAAGEPVIVHIRAAWAAPALKLESDVFTDEGVRDALAGYRRVYIDVSEGTAADDEIRALLGVETVPEVLVWTDAARLAHGLETGTVPEPELRLRTFVSAPSAFLQQLP